MYFVANLEKAVSLFSERTVFVACIFLFLLLLVAAFTKQSYAKRLKAPLFVLICFVVVATTLSLWSSSIYLLQHNQTVSDEGTLND
jgi:hypothetical protein